MLNILFSVSLLQTLFLVVFVNKDRCHTADNGCDNTCDAIEDATASYRTDAKAKHDKVNHYKNRCTEERCELQPTEI